MSMTKETLERLAKEVVDEGQEDKHGIIDSSKMYLGLVIGMARLMDKIKKEELIWAT